MSMFKQLTDAIRAGIRCRVERDPKRNRYWITRDDKETCQLQKKSHYPRIPLAEHGIFGPKPHA